MGLGMKMGREKWTTIGNEFTMMACFMVGWSLGDRSIQRWESTVTGGYKIGGQGTLVTDDQSVLIVWVPQLEKAGLGFLGDRTYICKRAYAVSMEQRGRMLTEWHMDLGGLLSGWSNKLRRNPGRRGGSVHIAGSWRSDKVKEDTAGS